MFGLWVMGAAGPVAGRVGDRVGWRLGGLGVAAGGVLLSLPESAGTLVLALALIVLGMFSGVTAAQLGMAGSGDTDRGVASAV